jgi:NTE family protein
MKLKHWLSQDSFSLSLSAGFFGFYSHCGFVKALWEKGFKPQKIVGASAGALTGSLLCAGYDPVEIEKIIANIRREDVWDLKLGFGLLEGKKFRDILSKYLPQHFSDLKIPLSVSAFNLSNLKGVSLQQGDLISAVQASCCFPMLFHPVSREGTKYIDGGVTDWMGLSGVNTRERILIHNIEPTGPGAQLMKLQIYKELKKKPESYVVQNSGLHQMGLTRMHMAKQAIDRAYHLTLEKLQQ